LTSLDKNKGAYFKIIVIWLAIILLGCFWLSLSSASGPVTLTVMPEVPREGQPVFATFKLNNPSSEPLSTSFQFYTNGVLVSEGKTTIAPNSSQLNQHVYENPLPVGEQVIFLVAAQSPKGNYERVVSIPPYPPQVWTSFISFASFSTAVISSISSMNALAYYQGSFTGAVFNIGTFVCLVLIVLLIFMELAGKPIQGRSLVLGQLRIRLVTLTWILLIVFVAMVYTRVVLILIG
jgi:hypothetical protein